MTMTKAGKSLFLMLWTGACVTEVMCVRSSMDGTDELSQGETSSAAAGGRGWPASNALLDGRSCPAWPESNSVAIAGTSYGGNGQQWIQVDLGSQKRVGWVKYYGKAILHGTYAGDIQKVELCHGDYSDQCFSCRKIGSDSVDQFYHCSYWTGRYVRITRTPRCCNGANWHFCRIQITDTKNNLINTGLQVTSSIEYQLPRVDWPATNALLPGTTCPAWPEFNSVAIAGTSYGGNGQQWIQVDLGSQKTVETVKYYGKAILHGTYAGDIQKVQLCFGDQGNECSGCRADAGDNEGNFYQCGSKQGRYVLITRTPGCCNGANWHFCRIGVTGELIKPGLQVTSSKEYQRAPVMWLMHGKAGCITFGIGCSGFQSWAGTQLWYPGALGNKCLSVSNNEKFVLVTCGSGLSWYHKFNKVNQWVPKKTGSISRAYWTVTEKWV